MIAVIIQARMGSTRLPGKIMKELVGKPMLWHVVNRVKHAKKIDTAIVATTILPEDDVVEELAKKEGWDYFRGSAENVLERYYNAAKKFGAETVVRITSDCPLIDPEIIDRCIEAFQKQNCDYISNINPESRTFPRGFDVEIFSFNALQRTYIEAKEQNEQGHVTPYMWENKKEAFILGPMVTASSEYARDYRLTVDYPEDFMLIEKIYQAFPSSVIVGGKEAIAFLDAYPDIAKINATCIQKTI